MSTQNLEAPLTDREKKAQSKPRIAGALLVDKPTGHSSFSLIYQLRKRLQIKKIGHAGTLDPLATGVMIYLVGREFTRLSDRFLNMGKSYQTKILLGSISDSYDRDGVITEISHAVPSKEALDAALASFQGKILQTPPMFSAKKKQGKKLYEYARKGIEIERAPCEVELETSLISYEYPYVTLQINCSKGTYIRSIAHDLGQRLGCGALVYELRRISSGPFTIDQCIKLDETSDISAHLLDEPTLMPYLERSSIASQ